MGNAFSVSVSCDEVVKRICNCIAGEAENLCKLEENIDALKTALQELRNLRNDVIRRVEIDEERRLQILDVVKGWLSRVEAVEIEVDELIQASPQETQRLCLGGCCSKNCKSSYKFGKKIAKKLRDVEDLKCKGGFEEVAGKVPAITVDERPSNPTVGLELILDKIWNCIQEKEIGIYGLYGMGGVGKTTLLTQINNKFLNAPKDFDAVIWVLVSKDLQLERIQEDIGKRLGLSDEQWKNKRLDEKALDIHRSLSKKKFLLLLDDIWERIDLVQVGIPHPNQQNGSKIVFTTRSEEVCSNMEADDALEVKCLAWNDAWDLFQKKVGRRVLSIHPEIPVLAKRVAKRCCGLPLALITTARAMACKKTPQEWRHAVDVLKKSASEFAGMGDRMFPLLKFSYDNLSDKLRSCFLYCALFPEDFSIKKEELIDFWIGEGMVDGYDGRGGAVNLGYHIIGTLVHACLLVEEEGNCVKMHDVLRDMALWIACDCEKEKENFFVQAGAQLSEAPNAQKWEGAKRVSLMVNDIRNLTETPRCSHLLTLFLRRNGLMSFPSDFFDFMPSLTVLDMSLNQNGFKLPAGISNLLSLQYLNLSGSSIAELPVGLKNLIKLKYLNLEGTVLINKIPMKVIASLLNLEVLRISGCGGFSDIPEDNVLYGGNELLIEELQGLRHLNMLTISIKTASALQQFLGIRKLQNCTQALSLDRLSASDSIDMSFLASMKHLHSLTIWLSDVSGLKVDCVSEGRMSGNSNDVTKLAVPSNRCFDNLCRVKVDFCSGCEDLTWLTFAPNLTHLSVSRMELKEIISERKLNEVSEGEENLVPFRKLEVLILIHLEGLKSIYWGPLLFPFLRRINVFNCPRLKKLPLNRDSAKERNVVIEGEEHWRNELEWEDEATKNVFLPRCRSERIGMDDEW